MRCTVLYCRHCCSCVAAAALSACSARFWWEQTSRGVLAQLYGPQEAAGSGSGSGGTGTGSPVALGSSEAASAQAPGGHAHATEALRGLFRGMPITQDVFGWAIAVVMSRTFGLRRCGCGARVGIDGGGGTCRRRYI